MDLSKHLQEMQAGMPWAPVVTPGGDPTSSVVPFLKWAGGKRWLMPLALRLRGQVRGTYLEPFLGSGAIFFTLQPSRAVLSDRNEELIDTYQAVKDDWEQVVEHLKTHDRKHSHEYYYEVRSRVCRTAATKAARFIYLNRTCWNGLYRVNKAGIFNTPIGTKARAILDTDDFEAIASCLSAVTLVSGDFARQVDAAQAGDFIFADPPYTVRHQYNGFVKYNEHLFSWEDQERLAAALVRAKNRGVSVLCTNADHSSIRELYGQDFELVPVSRYSSIAGLGGTRGRYAEILAIG